MQGLTPNEYGLVVGEGHGHSAPGQLHQHHHQWPLPKEILVETPPTLQPPCCWLRPELVQPTS